MQISFKLVYSINPFSFQYFTKNYCAAFLKVVFDTSFDYHNPHTLLPIEMQHIEMKHVYLNEKLFRPLNEGLEMKQSQNKAHEFLANELDYSNYTIFGQ